MPRPTPDTSVTLAEAQSLLGVDATTDAEGLARAFRRAAKAARPDLPGGDAERFRRVIEAHRVLKAAGLARATLSAATHGPCPAKGSPAPAELEITPAEALSGLARRCRLPDARSLGLRLPAGLRTGETVRLKGQGPAGSDLELKVRITAQPGVKVMGDDLWIEAPCPVATLRDGGRLTVETPSGPVAVWVPPALPDPPRLRLKGQGLPARGRHPQGHLFITLVRAAEAAPPPSAAQARLNRFQQAWTRRSPRAAGDL